MLRFVSLIILICAYLSFAQLPYTVKEDGYWSQKSFKASYWVLRRQAIKLEGNAVVVIEAASDTMLSEYNEGFYEALTAIIDGSVVTILALGMYYVLLY